MVKSVTLKNYKGFRHTRVQLGETSVLVGANNAGKSTVIGALRLVAATLPLARSRGYNGFIPKGAGRLSGWAISAAAIEAAAFTAENVRHDFRQEEARIEVAFDSGITLSLTWPEVPDDADDMDDVPPPVMSLEAADGRIKPRVAVSTMVPSIGVVPGLTPVEDRELRVAPDTLRRNITSRRTSRSFRNALLSVQNQSDGQWEELVAFLLSVTPELTGLSLQVRPTDRGHELDLFYREPGGRDRELTWAGYGLQIWLQAMFHVWRNRDADVLVLDEPDVFLHPELQRRLARHLFALPAQLIMATHSVEVLAEGPPGSAVWVDRTRRNSERPRRDGALAMLGRRLGSGLELGIARALRSQLALFVEGQDMRMLAHMADAVGARRLSAAAEVSVVQLGGFDRRQLASAFAEVLSVLGSEVRVRVLLDRDLRDDATVQQIEAELVRSGAGAHVWRRKELESYLLSADAIARRALTSEEEAQELLDEHVAGLETETRQSLVGRRLEARGPLNQRSIIRDAEDEFNALWTTAEGRLRLVAPKRVLSAMNATLQARGRRTLNPRGLSAALTAESLPAEMHSVLSGLEDLLAP